jgi:hypothetical protein
VLKKFEEEDGDRSMTIRQISSLQVRYMQVSRSEARLEQSERALYSDEWMTGRVGIQEVSAHMEEMD